MTMSFASFDKLLRAFRRLPAAQPREPTLLEITGYQRQELLSSNILAFFLDPANLHGLGTALLDALLTSVGAEPMQGSTYIDVRTEVYTQQGKRLDIVIDAGSLVVAIENKIDHAAINPFDEYRAELEMLSAGRPWVGVLLSLRPIAPSPAFCGFRPVTYAIYFQALAHYLGGALLTAREPYLMFLRDFMRTIGDLVRETSMDAATLAFYRDNQNDIEQLLSSVDALRADMHQKLKTLESLVDTNVCGMQVIPHYDSPLELLSDMLIYVVKPTNELQISIIVHLKPTGWHINLTHALGEQPHRRQAIAAFLSVRNIPFRQRNYPTIWRLGYGSDALAYDAPLAQVQDEVQTLFRLLGGLPQIE
jgi:PD-(D/E)XK nuclease superfamily